MGPNLYPAIVILALLAVTIVMHRIRRRLRDPAADRVTEAETIARLDAIAAQSDRRAARRAKDRRPGADGPDA